MGDSAHQPLVLPLRQTLPGAQPLCGPLAVLRHQAGRQKATLSWVTLHYPHHHWQPQPSSGQAAAVRPGTRSSSLCQHTGLCLTSHHARRASEPQHLLHVVTVPAKGLTAAWTQQRAGTGQKRTEPWLHGSCRSTRSHRLTVAELNASGDPQSRQSSTHFQVSLSTHEVSEASRITWG